MSQEADDFMNAVAEWQWMRLKRETASEVHWADICRWHAAQLIGRGA